MKMKRIPRQKSFFVSASVLKRLIAFFVDIVIINLVIVTPFSGLLQKIIPEGSYQETYDFLMSSSGNPVIISIILAAITVLSIFYFAIFESRLGQSPGKVLMNLYIVSLEKNCKPGFWQCVVRTLFIIPFFPFSILWVADPITALFNRHNQRLMELLSKTKVVETHSLG